MKRHSKIKHDKEELIKHVYNTVKNFAFSKSMDRQQGQDFLQEGLIAAFEVIDKYKNRSKKDMIKIMVQSAKNRIKTVLVKEINWVRRNNKKTVKMNKPIDCWYIDDNNDTDKMSEFDISYDEVIERTFLRALEFYLEVSERKILREKLQPGKRTLSILEKEIAGKIIKRSNGNLVMNLKNPNINNNHIAESLGISKATVSRAFKNIQEAIQFLTGSQ